MSTTGEIGQDFFKLLCSQAGIVCNPSLQDQAGWDFKLDFSGDDALDLQNVHKSPQHCIVQVKATAKNLRSFNIKLSNAHRYATTLEPVFIAVIQIDKSGSAKRLFVIHFDEKLIERTLSRVTKERQTDNRSLNRCKIKITAKAIDEVSPITGISLKTRLRHHISDDVQEYMSRKHNFLQRAGYSDQSGNISFKISSPEDLKDLIEMSIGLKESAQIVDVSKSIKRFESLEKDSSQSSSTGTLSMPDLVPNAKGKFRIYPSAQGGFVEFPAELFISPFFAAAQGGGLEMIKEDTAVAKLVSGPLLLEFNRDFSRAKFNIDIDFGAKIPFYEILKYAKLLSLIYEPENNPSFELWVDNKKVWTNEFVVNQSSFNLDSWLISDSETIKKVKIIFDYFEVDHTTQISWAEINEARNSISQYHSIISKNRMVYKVIFGVPDGHKISKNENRYITHLAFRIGTFGFGLVVSLRGRLSREESDDVIMYSRDLTVEHKRLAFLPDDDFLNSLSELVRKVVSSADDDENVIIDSEIDPE